MEMETTTTYKIYELVNGLLLPPKEHGDVKYSEYETEKKALDAIQNNGSDCSEELIILTVASKRIKW